MQESIREGTSVSKFIGSCQNEKQRLFCYVMYTSASTGEPKGLCGIEEGLINRFLWMHGICPFSKDEVLLFKTSISFVDHLQEFLGAILSASALVIPPFNELTDYPFSIINFLQAFCDALVVVEVSDDDDFFKMGGNSVSAAHVCYNLRMHMRLLYNFPTPSKLFSALLNEVDFGEIDIKSGANGTVNVKEEKGGVSYVVGSATRNHVILESNKPPSKNPYEKQDGDFVAKRLKVDLEEYICSKASSSDRNLWCPLVPLPCANSRCNKVMKRNENKYSNSGPLTRMSICSSDHMLISSNVLMPRMILSCGKSYSKEESSVQQQ